MKEENKQYFWVNLLSMNKTKSHSAPGVFTLLESWESKLNLAQGCVIGCRLGIVGYMDGRSKNNVISQLIRALLLV